MRLALLLAIGLPALLPAQTLLRASAGVTAGTPLVRDFLGDDVTVTQPAPVPTVAVQVSHTLESGYRVGVEARVARGSTEVEDRRETADLGTLTTIGIMALVEGPVRGAVRWQVGLGALSYRPAEEIGIWSDGGTTRWLAGGGLTWTRSMGSLDLVVGARYDFHPFSTPRLDAEGYAGYQAVHRGGLTIGLERGF